MPPVMAPRRVVALFEPKRLTPTGCAVVEKVLERTPPELTLVVTATVPKGSRKAFYRKLKERAVALEWAAPRDAEIPGWLIERASKSTGWRWKRVPPRHWPRPSAPISDCSRPSWRSLPPTGDGGVVIVGANRRTRAQRAAGEPLGMARFGSRARLPERPGRPVGAPVGARLQRRGSINAMTNHHVLLGSRRRAARRSSSAPWAR